GSVACVRLTCLSVASSRPKLLVASACGIKSSRSGGRRGGRVAETHCGRRDVPAADQADGRTTDRGGTGIGQGCRSPWLSYRPVDVATCGGDHRAVDRRVVPPWSCVVRPTQRTSMDLAAVSPTGDPTAR